MFIRKLAAGAALVGAMTLGPVAVAGAQTTQPPAATSTTRCRQAEALLATLQQRDQKVQDQITALEARVDALRQAGRNARADALQKRIDALKDRLSRVEARVSKLEARVDAKCHVVAPPGDGTQGS